MATLANFGGHTNATLPEDEQAEEIVTTINTLLNLLSDGMNQSLPVNINDVAGSPTEASFTLSTDDFLGNGLFILQGSPTVEGTLTLPSNTGDEKYCGFINNTGQTIVVVVSGAGSPQEIASLESGESAICHYDGDTNIRKLVGSVATSIAGGTPYDISFYFPTTGEGTILTHVVVRAFTLSSGLPGSQAAADTGNGSGEDEPTWDIRKNGSSIGTITFQELAQAGTFTFSSDQSFSPGDRLSVVDLNDGSPTPITSVQGVAVTFKVEI